MPPDRGASIAPAGHGFAKFLAARVAGALRSPSLIYPSAKRRKPLVAISPSKGPMITRYLLATASVSMALSGCASVQYGSKDTEAILKRLDPIPGKTSLYVCRESAAFFGAGNRTTAIVNNKPIATLKPNNFAHVIVEPGPQEVFVKRNPGGDSGILKLNTRADEVAIVWVGMTGAGFGVLTVDQFSSKTEAESCVKGAEYAVLAE